MTTVSAPVAHRGFDDAPRSPGQARTFVRETLRAWGREDLEDTLLLIVSELATNVVLHARTPYEVSLERRGDLVRLSVLDGSPSGPVRRRAALRSATGRGMALVDTLSQDWGRTNEAGLRGHAKGIWCDVAAGGTALDEGAMYGDDWLAQLEG